LYNATAFVWSSKSKLPRCHFFPLKQYSTSHLERLLCQ
jgi:hypothetical protein